MFFKIWTGLKNFLLIVFSLVAGVFILNNNLSEYNDNKSDSSEYNGGKRNYAESKICNYECKGYLEADTTTRCSAYNPCKAAATSNNPNPKPKISYKTSNDAIKGAIYFGEKYNNQGNKVYKCPNGYGFHLTTTTYSTWFSDGEKIEAGKIYDLYGEDISSEVCSNHKKCFWAKK